MPFWVTVVAHGQVELSCRIVEPTGDHNRTGSYFRKRLSLAIQRGNFASPLATMGAALDEIFHPYIV